MPNQEKAFFIGAVSKMTKVNIETIRYYEKVGAINPPDRGENGYRLYTKAHVERLEFVKRCRSLGFSLKHTSSLLQLADSEDRTCSEVYYIAEQRLDETREKIADLKRMESVLENFVDICPRDASSQCPIISALSVQA